MEFYDFLKIFSTSFLSPLCGGAPQAPWRHTEGCARGAPTSFRIGPDFVGSLTKIETLVLKSQ